MIQCQVRRTLLHTIDDVFCPIDGKDTPLRREPVSLKELFRQTIAGMDHQHCGHDHQFTTPSNRALAEDSGQHPKVPKAYKQGFGKTSINVHCLARNTIIFGQLQKALSNSNGGRVTLKCGVHQALDDFSVDSG